MDTQVTEEDRLMIQGFHRLKDMESRLKEMLEQPKPACLRDEPQRTTFADADRSEDFQTSKTDPAKPLVRSYTTENPGANDATLAARDRLKRVFDKTDGPSRPLTPVSLQTSENLKTSAASSTYLPRRYSEAKAIDHPHLLGRPGIHGTQHKPNLSNSRTAEPGPELRRLPENLDRTAKIEDLEKKIFKLRQENSGFNPSTTRKATESTKAQPLPPKTPATAVRRMNLQARGPPADPGRQSRQPASSQSSQQLPPRAVPKLEVPCGLYHRNTSFGEIDIASADRNHFNASAYQRRPTEKMRTVPADLVFERQDDSSARDRMQARAPQAHFYNPCVERFDTTPDSCSEMQKIDRLYTSFLENKKFWEDFKAKRESSKKTHIARGRDLPSAHRFQAQKEYAFPTDSRDAQIARKKVEAKDDWCDSSDLSDITERKHYNRPEKTQKPERTRLLHK